MNLGDTTRNTEDLVTTTLELQVCLLFAMVALHLPSYSLGLDDFLLNT